MSNSEGSPFECRVSQLYVSLPVTDQMVQEDGADTFFDAPSSPPRDDESLGDVFATPMTLPYKPKEEPKSGRIPKILELPEIEEEADAQLKARCSSDFPAGRIILKAKRRSLQLPKKINESIKEDIDSTVRTFEGIKLDEVPLEKEHSMTTRQDVAARTPVLCLRNRHIVRVQMKRVRVQSPSVKGPPVKYMALAEQVQHFFKDTPPRFRTQMKNAPRRLDLVDQKKLTLTYPQSPALLTKTRLRSPKQLPKEEETHQIKALPFNPKVFQAPDCSSKPPAKPATIPQPFNLTEVSTKVHKDEESAEMPIEFKARPVPRSCRSAMSSLSSNSSVNTHIFRVPVMDGEDHHDSTHVGVPNKSSVTGRLKVEPFSFDMRDRLAQKRKQRKIEEMIEAATRIPKFTANPLPSFIASSANSSRTSTATVPPTKEPTTFKAKPAKVLYKDPFVPKKESKPLTNVTAFELNTEKRAKERAAFDKALAEREEADRMLCQKLSMEQQKREKEEIVRLRQSLVHKAKPAP